MAYQWLPKYQIRVPLFKAVSHKNSKCLHFVLVQVTSIVQKSTISLSCYTKSKNDSYSTQWHNRGFQSIKLVSNYSKSVSHKNSKCLDFVLVQLTSIVQKGPISPSCCKRSDKKITPIRVNGITKASKYAIISHYSKSVSRKNSKCLDFVLVQATRIVQNSPISLSC